MNSDITYAITIAQAVAPAVSDAVQSNLQPLLGQLHASGGIHQGDVLYAAGKVFRVASRSWDLNDGHRILEVKLVLV